MSKNIASKTPEILRMRGKVLAIITAKIPKIDQKRHGKCTLRGVSGVSVRSKVPGRTGEVWFSSCPRLPLGVVRNLVGVLLEWGESDTRPGVGRAATRAWVGVIERDFAKAESFLSLTAASRGVGTFGVSTTMWRVNICAIIQRSLTRKLTIFGTGKKIKRRATLVSIIYMKNKTYHLRNQEIPSSPDPRKFLVSWMHLRCLYTQAKKSLQLETPVQAS